MPSFAELRSRLSNSTGTQWSSGTREMLISDSRGHLNPQQAVEQKLGVALRRGERFRPPARSSLTDEQAGVE